MPIPLVTGFYAGLLGLLLFLLTAHVGRTRVKTGISLLDGSNRDMTIAIRRQGNFIELVPFCLILLAIAEMARTSIYMIHILGIILVVSRIIHPFGVKPETYDVFARKVGAGGTMIVLLILSVWDIYLYLVRVALVGP
jgi:uncharacterized membrane protein YecN with MAPEG domain